MDLELSDEQTWLAESVQTLLAREWSPAPDAPYGDEAARDRLWRALVDFGALTVGGEDGLGAVELCLIARALGAHLAPVPYLGERRGALRGRSRSPMAKTPSRSRCSSRDRAGPASAAHHDRPDAGRRRPQRPQGRASSTRSAVERLAVAASGPDGAGLAVVAAARARRRPDRAARVRRDRAHVRGRPRRRPRSWRGAVRGRRRSTRLATIGALIAAAEAVGAAGRLLDDACRYAGERRQFGRTIGSFQALRHLLADMYVRQASSWSSVLYAAAALDEDAAERRTHGVDRQGVRVARGPRGGPRRDAGLRRHRGDGRAPRPPVPAPHRRARAAVRRRGPPRARARAGARGRRRPRARRLTRGAHAMTPTTATGFNDPTAQRLEAIATGAEPEVVGPLLADALHDPRWQRCDVALISGGKSNLTYRVACDAGEVVLRRPPLGHILPTAHDMVREHRVLTRAGGHGRPGAARPAPRRRRQRARARRSTSWSASSGTSAATRCPPGTPTRPKRRAAIGEALVDVLAEPAHRRPGRRGARGLRPAGGLHGAPAAALVEAVGGLQGARAPGARRAARRARAHAAAAARAKRSSTATTGSTTRCCTRRRRAASWPCSTGR